MSIPFSNSVISRPGGWNKFKKDACRRRTTLFLQDLQIYSTNQRLFNEKQSLTQHYIRPVSWTKPRSLCISWCHPCLNCTAATIHPSHTVSGTWNTACVVESKVSRSLPRCCLAHFGAATKRSNSDRLQITWQRIIQTCLLVSLGGVWGF